MPFFTVTTDTSIYDDDAALDSKLLVLLLVQGPGSHLVVTYDGVVHEVFYINGVLVKTWLELKLKGLLKSISPTVDLSIGTDLTKFGIPLQMMVQVHII